MAGTYPMLASILLCLSAVAAQDGESITLDDLLVAAKLPEGYQAMSKEIKVEDKVRGRMIVVSKPNQIAKVIVRIELREITSDLARRAASKAYVNAFVAGLAEAGYKVVEKDIPDFTTEKFTKPVSVGLVFANGEGKKLWNHQEIFFTSNGFVAQVIAEDPANLARLTKWTKTIKPRPTP